MATDHLESETLHSRHWSVFIPLLILVVTYLAWTVFQTSQLMRERDTLAGLQLNQEKQVQESKKLRESLDKIARETQVLANRGNKGALLVVEELRKRGITINPEAPAQAAPAPTPAAPSKNRLERSALACNPNGSQTRGTVTPTRISYSEGGT